MVERYRSKPQQPLTRRKRSFVYQPNAQEIVRRALAKDNPFLDAQAIGECRRTLVVEWQGNLAHLVRVEAQAAKKDEPLDHHELILRLLEHGRLNSWERRFLRNIFKREQLTEKQLDKLCAIVREQDDRSA